MPVLLANYARLSACFALGLQAAQVARQVFMFLLGHALVVRITVILVITQESV